jgi:cobalt ABC transporter, permease protein CbiQ
MIIIDKLAYSSSIRYFSPYIKVFFSIITLVCCVTSTSILFPLLMLAVMGGSTIYYSAISISKYIKLLYLPGSFIILSLIAIIFEISSVPMDFLAIDLGSVYLTASKANMVYAFQLSLKAFSGTSCLYFMTLTTPIIDFLEVLKRLHVPKFLIELMLLIYRFIFIIMENALSMLQAQQCRMGHKNMRTSITSMGNMLSVLLVKSYRRTDNLYNAMEARGYNGEFKFAVAFKRATLKQIIIFCVLQMFIIVMAILL